MDTAKPEIIAGDAATSALLNDKDRRKSHGPFREHAELSQVLKLHMQLVNGGEPWNELDADMRESLEMIQHKIARIIVGDATTIDHWADIAGYATLVADRLRKEQAK